MAVTVRPAMPPALRMAAMLGAWAVASFALMRSASLRTLVLLPFAEWQAALVSWLSGRAALPVAMVPDCSGLDVMALCAGAIVLYPASVRQRSTGVLMGLALLLALNIVRIATLSSAAASPQFGMLHEFVWPAVLTVAAVVYVGGWMWRVDRPSLLPRAAGARLALITGVLLLVYVVTIAGLAQAGVLDVYAADVAAAAAALLRTCGIDAALNGRVLQVGEIHYLITYECVTTPLLPVYLAAALVVPRRGVVRAAAVALAPPLFIALSIVRLTTLAAPPLLFGSRLFLTHGFNQFLFGLVAVALAAAVAHHRSGWRAVTQRAATAIGVGLVFALTAGTMLTWLLGAAFPSAMRDASDVQGAVRVLPAFQVALLAALLFAIGQHVTRTTCLWAALLIVASQVAALALVPALRPLASPEALALAWRGWALALPLAAAALLYRRSG